MDHHTYVSPPVVAECVTRLHRLMRQIIGAIDDKSGWPGLQQQRSTLRKLLSLNGQAVASHW